MDLVPRPSKPLSPIKENKVFKSSTVEIKIISEKKLHEDYSSIKPVVDNKRFRQFVPVKSFHIDEQPL
jgi:hypothetical protein